MPEATLLAGAAELAVSTGALEEAIPLAVSVVVGVLDGVGVGVGVTDSVGVLDGVGVGDAECDGVELGECDVDLDGVGDVGLPLVPLGLSEGVPLLDGGVGSSEVP
ncbi:hypothetical protein [Streptomyces sp. MBT53]|uniref:hypothetical protein n=1 Tax=Streptomyces sp. MBT53 TaxID=1488384 RepID=UPI001913E34D|nr:hypothetical protein [Streptomyces sp. MBT53]MBK6019544.1 hypothetical protein [Streptomyces sp. MBT53]